MKSASEQTFSQAQVEAATGFSREVLRKWEIRFGFPIPLRDSRHRRLYSSEDLHRLQLIRQLLHVGHRPRNLVPLSVQALKQLKAPVQEPTSLPCPQAVALLQALNSRTAPSDLADYLRFRLNAVGLQAFAVNDLPIFCDIAGTAWANGSMGVHDEHLFTASVDQIVREKVAQQQASDGARRVLLTTPPGEQHGLGILMMHAALASRGAHCINLGLQTPAEYVDSAVRKWDVSIVCISVSLFFSASKVLAYLVTLRELLPTGCQIWLGGAGARPIAAAVPNGVLVFENLQAAIDTWVNTA